MAQTNKKCPYCKELGHSGFYCKSPLKPRKEIPRTAIKQTVKAPVKKKAKKRSYYVKKLDTVFSQYIRQSKSVDGIATCVTCGSQKPWKEMQNGHFYTRGRYGTRWDETNCHIQDAACNVFLKGNYIIYTRYMIDKYGREYVDDLEKKSLTTTKFTTVEIQEMIEKYQRLLTL